MHDDSDVDYIVPVGKKFVILKIMPNAATYYSTSGGNVNMQISTISKSTVTDVAGTVFFICNSTNTGRANSGQGLTSQHYRS